MYGIRLVNTTTDLPVDSTLEKAFFRTIGPGFAAAIVKHGSRHHIDVHFVGPKDEHLQRSASKHRDQSIDYLGVYVPHHGKVHHARIKVCPERVRDACLAMKPMSKHFSMKQMYQTLLTAVAIHELAHALMDPNSVKARCHTVPWEAYFRPVAKIRPQPSEWDNVPYASAADEQEHYHDRCLAWFHQFRMGQDRNSLRFPDEPDVTKWRSLVEESLATAFELRQRLAVQEAAMVREFSAHQPAEYRAGLNWSGSLRDLLRTAASWRMYKAETLESRNLSSSPAVAPKQLLHLKEIVARLSDGESVNSFDFQKDYR